MLSLTTIVFVRHFGNEIPLTINHGREMSTISGKALGRTVPLIIFFEHYVLSRVKLKIPNTRALRHPWANAIIL